MIGRGQLPQWIGLPGPFIPERREQVFGISSISDLPRFRQQAGAGLASNPSAGFPHHPLYGSILVAWLTSESNVTKTPSGSGAVWENVYTLNSSGGGMFTSFWVGRVVTQTNAVVSVSSSSGTTGMIIAEFTGLKGRVHTFTNQQGHGTFGPVCKPIGWQGVQVGVSGHRGGTPAMPTDTGAGGSRWMYIHQRNNDLSMIWSPLSEQLALSWGGGPSSNQQAGIVVIV